MFPLSKKKLIDEIRATHLYVYMHVLSNRVRICLEQRFFVGKMKETKTEKRKTRRPFGTKETSRTFPPEACSNNTVSQEKNICSYL